MPTKFPAHLRSSLLLSAALSLGLATLIPPANAGVGLNGANLNGISLNGTSFNGTNLNGTNLNGANLNGANLNGASLNGIVLNGSQFAGSTSTAHLQLEGSQLVLHLD